MGAFIKQGMKQGMKQLDVTALFLWFGWMRTQFLNKTKKGYYFSLHSPFFIEIFFRKHHYVDITLFLGLLSHTHRQYSSLELLSKHYYMSTLCFLLPLLYI